MFEWVDNSYSEKKNAIVINHQMILHKQIAKRAPSFFSHIVRS